MYKQSPSRGHRSKGIKVKNILQICLLLAVCFWLVYQVKHSQEKRREFDAKDEKVVDKSQSGIIKFGRKDLPRVTELATDDLKHGEDEEDKEAEEEDNRHEEAENKPVQDDNKHEEEDSEGDERIDEREEERGAGDDEIDENDLEKSEGEHEHGEEQAEENNDREDNDGDAERNHPEDEDTEEPAKEKHIAGEENEDTGKEGRSELEETRDVDTEDHNERDAASDDQDHDADSTDTHEAREELYKADDASSEVAHNVQTFNSETENVTMGHANDIFGKVNFGQENETTTSVNAALVKSEEQPLVDNDGVSKGTVIQQKTQENNLITSDDGSLQNLQNLTSATLPNNQPEINRNSTSIDKEHLALFNGTQPSDTNLPQNATMGDTTGHGDPKLLGTVLDEHNKPKLSADDINLSEDKANLNKTENADAKAGEILSSKNTTVDSSQKLNNSDAAEVGKDSSVGDENQSEKSENDGAGGSDETSTSHSDDENAGAMQHDPIDASDTSISEEEKESSVDLDTLPDIKSEAQNSEEDTAE